MWCSAWRECTRGLQPPNTAPDPPRIPSASTVESLQRSWYDYILGRAKVGFIPVSLFINDCVIFYTNNCKLILSHLVHYYNPQGC